MWLGNFSKLSHCAVGAVHYPQFTWDSCHIQRMDHGHSQTADCQRSVALWLWQLANKGKKIFWNRVFSSHLSVIVDQMKVFTLKCFRSVINTLWHDNSTKQVSYKQLPAVNIYGGLLAGKHSLISASICQPQFGFWS